MSLKVILVKNPKSIPKETSIDMGDYFIVYSFEYTSETMCENLETGENISPSEAINGARYGRFECRVANDKIKHQQSVYEPDNTVFKMSLVACGGVALLALFFGK
jgi:hypothetical protein